MKWQSKLILLILAVTMTACGRIYPPAPKYKGYALIFNEEEVRKK